MLTRGGRKKREKKRGRGKGEPERRASIGDSPALIDLGGGRRDLEFLCFHFLPDRQSKGWKICIAEGRRGRRKGRVYGDKRLETFPFSPSRRAEKGSWGGKGRGGKEQRPVLCDASGLLPGRNEEGRRKGGCGFHYLKSLVLMKGGGSLRKGRWRECAFGILNREAKKGEGGGRWNLNTKITNGRGEEDPREKGGKEGKGRTILSTLSLALQYLQRRRKKEPGRGGKRKKRGKSEIQKSQNHKLESVRVA